MQLVSIPVVLAFFLVAPPATAASDTALRAVYCLPIIDSEIATQRQISQELLNTSMPAHQRQQIENSTAQLEQWITDNRQRLATYAASNGVLGAINNLDEAAAFLGAKRRGEIDAAQCAAEKQSGIICAYECTRRCTPANLPCFQRCSTVCNMPTCARTFACINPTWLPY
ncbi:MAG: hypothetical protein AB7H90_07130 [Alphaproteobacteria bacterium]